MRGIEQIKEINENPHGRPTEEHFGTRFVGEDTTEPKTETASSGRPKTKSSFADNFAKLTLVDTLFGVTTTPGELAELAAVATILDAFGVAHPADYDEAKALAVKLAKKSIADAKTASSQDRIQPGIDLPPFLNFWSSLNARRERAGLPEARYKEAKTLFEGGETPLGAMTFVGKQWDGLRAVPAKPVTYLGGTRPSYHGQHREITGTGTLWHTVTGPSGPILYTCPEAALVAAKDAKQAMIDAKFR